MKKLKPVYDETLRKIYIRQYGPGSENDFPWSPEYPNYFRKGLISYIALTMRPEVLEAYMDGEGGELLPSREKRREPPKFASIASSARFCYESLEMFKDTKEGEGADFFARSRRHIETVEFEKVLPIASVRGSNPSMDAYAFDGKREYFFECKCHEMFDHHHLNLSKQYFSTGLCLIVNHIRDEFLKEEGGELLFDPKAFGEADTLFDIKQLLTHLMGIVCNRKTQETDLIFYYNLPKEEDIRAVVEDPVVRDAILEVVKKTTADAIKIFESPIIKDYCKARNITLRLFVKDAAVLLSPASKDNTIELYDGSRQ